MKQGSNKQSTTVGVVDEDVLEYTAGEDIRLDGRLVTADCVGSAAHVTVLAQAEVEPRVISKEECKAVIAELAEILRLDAAGEFSITLADQDVHMAIERRLTAVLGDLGKKVHTGRSRNDQVTTALRLYTKEQLAEAVMETAQLTKALLKFAKKHEKVPMAGRTHLQPAMPSSVGLWAASFAESLLDDAVLLINAYELNDQCPLGAAASYGVPLPLDRELAAELLGFSRPTQTVLYAVTARGKIESIVLSALSQVMLSLSRLAEDLILFSMPEFGYFKLPREYCTGSSIMPQKLNPDVLELVRGKTSRVMAEHMAVSNIIRSLPSGYNRDVQETKQPLMSGLDTTRTSLRIMRRFVEGLSVDRNALLAGFTPDVFATDRALQLVSEGMPFRDAYHYVKEHLDELEGMDAQETVLKKKSLGAPGNLGLDVLKARASEASAWSRDEQKLYGRAWRKLLGVKVPWEAEA